MAFGGHRFFASILVRLQYCGALHVLFGLLGLSYLCQNQSEIVLRLRIIRIGSDRAL